MTEIEVNRQIGNYVVAQMEPSIHTGGCRFAVRMAGATEYLSFHQNVTDSVHAILRYRAADKRRSRAA